MAQDGVKPPFGSPGGPITQSAWFQKDVILRSGAKKNLSATTRFFASLRMTTISFRLTHY